LAEARVVDCLACYRGGGREADCLGLLEKGAGVGALWERRRRSGGEEVLALLDRGWYEGEEGEHDCRFESKHGGCVMRYTTNE
jgi:hypothetical protein